MVSPELFELLERERLADILSISVFSQLKNARVYKEQQFLVSLPLKDVPTMYERALKARLERTAYVSPEAAEKEIDGEKASFKVVEIENEELLFQGAIDLLALLEDGTVWIIDYKYSRKGAESLKKRYAHQLALYKRATARILKVEPSKIRCAIVNLLREFEVELDD